MAWAERIFSTSIRASIFSGPLRNLVDEGDIDRDQILPHPSNVVTEAVSQASVTMANHLRAAAI
ncbi:MAG: hypothetical protein L0312_32195, partial [Acidobacteria bacterium]|nr:hypothetical protein [Acidobacteriota bacterium]